jgi:hypothetical protein
MKGQLTLEQIEAKRSHDQFNSKNFEALELQKL